MKAKRCTNSSCRREFKLSTTVCPHCGKKYPRGGFDPGLRGQYAVVLTHVGPSKLSTIKVIRFRTGLGLRDAKTIIDNTPSLVARTLWGIGLAADMIQGCHPMRRALSRRNPGITEEVGIVAEWQNQRILTSISERSVNWQVINPVQG